MKLSIALPTSDMFDKKNLFVRCLESLWKQSFQDFEVVVTDNSDDNEIKSVCAYYKTGIKYYKNPIKGMAQNTNEAIRRSKGRLIKILYMDDFLFHENSLERIVAGFRGEWLVSGCNHTLTGVNFINEHIPSYSNDIQLGNNTIGSPSVVTT
jgi:glycosyltransferase involved in cell wall biosynthesis